MIEKEFVILLHGMGRTRRSMKALERRLDEMTDFIVVHSSHSFIMQNKTVLEQAAAFLKTGKFAVRIPFFRHGQH